MGSTDLFFTTLFRKEGKILFMFPCRVKLVYSLKKNFFRLLNSLAPENLSVLALRV